MSWQATAWVTKHSGHKGSALLTMLMLANHAGTDGSAIFPGLDSLAKDTRMSRRQVIRIIEKLLGSGELVQIPGRSPFGTNQYDMPGVRGDILSPPSDVTDTPSDVTFRASDVTSEAVRCDMAVPENVSELSNLELSIEPSKELAPAPRAKQKHALFVALCEATGRDPYGMTKPEARATAIANESLWQAHATPGQVFERASNYGTHYRDVALTPHALAMHWSLCIRPKRSSSPGEDTFIEALRLREEEKRDGERSLVSGG